MIDLRLYRLALLPALGCIVVLMFSLQPIPEPIEAPVSTPDFDGSEAARLARSIAASSPARKPGSGDDAAVADLVRERFAAIESGEVAVQELDSSFEGSDVTLQNVVLTLPGESEEVLLVLAHRDSASGPGAASSAASTAALIALAEDLGASRRNRTIVVASTAGGSDGADGARELVSSIPAPDGYAAGIALSQMGVAEPEKPVVVAPDPDGGSAPVKLVETAAALAEPRFGPGVARDGGFGQLARLAVPAAIGEGVALSEAGIDAVTITGNGERLVAEGADQADDVSSETLAQTGGLALALALSIDEAALSPAEADAPASYVRLGDNLIPGWALTLLGAALIVPGLVAAVDTWLRERREGPAAARRSIPWAAERILIPLLPLLLLYALALVGLAPDPSFPFEPDRFPFGAGAITLIVALGIAAALSSLLVRPMRTPLDAGPTLLAASAGVLSGVSLAGVWALNPYLGLLLAPLAHVWLLAARGEGSPRLGLVIGAIVVGFIPVIAALVVVATQLELGLSLPWYLLLLTTSGAIGVPMAALWCGLAGALLAVVAAARLDQRPRPTAQTLRTARTFVHTGALD